MVNFLCKDTLMWFVNFSLAIGGKYLYMSVCLYIAFVRCILRKQWMSLVWNLVLAARSPYVSKAKKLSNSVRIKLLVKRMSYILSDIIWTFDSSFFFLSHRLFERAIKVCGLDFRSDKLWEYYIKFEVQHQHFTRVTNIYDRLLNIPTQQLSTHMIKWVLSY